MTRQVKARDLLIGGGARVSVQSMTNTDTRDREATLAQLLDLANAGCELVRFAVFDEQSAGNVRYLVDHSPVPTCADIHFDANLAVSSIENGIDKLRINPGNIGSELEVRRVADCARAHHVPIRIGVNSGSLQKDILARDGGVTAKGLCNSALWHARLLENCGFSDIVLSMKSSDVRMTLDAYRLAARACDYPLHVGVTEAGTQGQGSIKSAIGIGALLLDGIGDTIRVSLTGSPVPEVKAGLDILRAVGLRPCVQLTSCPTCGRTRIDVEGIAKYLEDNLSGVQTNVHVAVMGCVVNGPGEAAGADIALCGGKGCAALYIKGRYARKLTGDLKTQMLRAVRAYINEAE